MYFFCCADRNTSGFVITRISRLGCKSIHSYLSRAFADAGAGARVRESSQAGGPACAASAAMGDVGARHVRAHTGKPCTCCVSETTFSVLLIFCTLYLTQVQGMREKPWAIAPKPRCVLCHPLHVHSGDVVSGEASVTYGALPA